MPDKTLLTEKSGEGFEFSRGTQREYSSKRYKLSIVERILVFKR